MSKTSQLNVKRLNKPKLQSKSGSNRKGSKKNNKQVRFFNREVSWLEFDRRVLARAVDVKFPLLERLKFLAIFSSNLDEFFMIRVSGLKEQIEEGVIEPSPDGLSAAAALAEVRRRLNPMLKQHSDCLNKIIFPQLRRAGVIIESYKTLDSKERRHLDRFFQENVFPILTPQSVDSSHPFPYISNLSLNLGFYIEPKRENIRPHLRNLFRQKRFARIKIPPTVPRFIPLAGRGTRFVLLEEIIAANAEKLFPNMKVSGGFLFRVTRDADIEIREDEAGDLMRTLETELQRRRFRFPVRLEVAADMPEKMLKLLSAGIGLEETDCYRIDGFMGAADLMQLYSLDLPKYKFKPFQPVHPALLLEKKNIFEVLKKEDVLLHHPYTAFTAVSDFAAQAAEDPRVQAIKICLYRTGRDSPIVRSLIRANQAGKQVTAVVELKARFDEENNIEWARRLENEGVHVVYGISRLKTHCKAMMVVRREGERLVRYVHLSTGNYNSVTARQYTDLGLLTSDNDLGEDVAGLFNFLTGYSQQADFKRLIVAPVNLREQILNLIKREAAAASAGLPARIIIKINSLTDTEVIEELYNASQAGVEVDLIVRGICSLRPGVKALSQRIRVKSIVGRFLEHSRIFYFANGDTDGKELLLIGSADLMQRNLDRRVEIIFPILNSAIKDYLKNEVLTAYLKDNANSWILRQTGSYKKMQDTGEIFDAQNYFIGKEIG